MNKISEGFRWFVAKFTTIRLPPRLALFTMDTWILHHIAALSSPFGERAFFYTMQFAFEIQALFSSCGMKKTVHWFSTAYCSVHNQDS
jgi:hypothetical protein